MLAKRLSINNNPRSILTMKLQYNISILDEASEGSRKKYLKSKTIKSKTIKRFYPIFICIFPFAAIDVSFWLKTCFWLTIPLSIISTQERCQWRLYLPWDFYSYLGPVEGPIKWIGRWCYPAPCYRYHQQHTSNLQRRR